MQREQAGTMLSAVFVDYDNIYLSLRRKNEEAAKRFAKNAARWLAGLQTGELIRASVPGEATLPRRLVMNRCYGNPVPRKNQGDNTTDMNSFPFVRHFFLKSGFEIIDCPPLTAQLKNSSDIKMVMDLRDFLTHETYFNEFIILSSDADFTPVLHRLRAHARRTVIFSNDHAAAAYTALADGAVHESDLIAFLLDGEAVDEVTLPAPEELAKIRTSIIEQVVKIVREAPAPVAIEALAERATRALGHDKTAGSQWGGLGGFLELLKADLPQDVQLTEAAPYFAYDLTRVAAAPAPAKIAAVPMPAAQLTPEPEPEAEQPAPARPAPQEPQPAAATQPAYEVAAEPAQPAPQPAQTEPAQSPADRSAQLQASVTRILDASQVPALSRPDYRAIFEEMAIEIKQNQLQGVQTIANVVARLANRHVPLKTEDARFILDVVGEADPWFEKEISPNIFAGRFRNFVAARCRSQGLSLSAQELDLIEMWFAGSAPEPVAAERAASMGLEQAASGTYGSQPAPQSDPSPATLTTVGFAGTDPADDMPRIVRAQPKM